MQWSEESRRIQASVLQAFPVSTLFLSRATSLVTTLVQPPGFLLYDGILILIQTVLLSFERWCQSVADTPHCPSSSVPILYITARPVLHVLPCSPPVCGSRCALSAPQAVKCLGHRQVGSRTGSLTLAQNHTGN